MTLVEAIEAAGPALQRREDGAPVLRGAVLPEEVVDVLRANRDRVGALLELRAIHRAMGYQESDVLFIEQALLADRELTIRIAALPPAEGVTA